MRCTWTLPGTTLHPHRCARQHPRQQRHNPHPLPVSPHKRHYPQPYHTLVRRRARSGTHHHTHAHATQHRPGRTAPCTRTTCSAHQPHSRQCAVSTWTLRLRLHNLRLSKHAVSQLHQQRQHADHAPDPTPRSQPDSPCVPSDLLAAELQPRAPGQTGSLAPEHEHGAASHATPLTRPSAALRPAQTSAYGSCHSECRLQRVQRSAAPWRTCWTSTTPPGHSKNRTQPDTHCSSY